jgi:hypothetical protein
MAKPPPTPPSSDIDGVDRDMRPGLVSRDPTPNPGELLDNARKQSAGRPDSTPIDPARAPPPPERESE